MSICRSLEFDSTSSDDNTALNEYDDPIRPGAGALAMGMTAVPP
ncbi:MAG: hypothetical protein ACYC61_01775 [Isosphaeraceae bacterium]